MAGTYPFEVEQGDDMSRLVTWFADEAQTIPVDITDYTWLMHVRRGYTSTDIVLVFTSPTTVELTDPTNGQITLNQTSATMAAVEPGKYVYDLAGTSPASIRDKLLKGTFTVVPESTK
jgi:hypothetical protein